MSIVEVNPDFVPWARIKVIWCGWGGCNTVNRMISEWLEWVEFIAVNTDAQVLATNLASIKMNIWLNLTKWLGAGADPEVGRKAAEENAEEIKKLLQDTDMVFITAGMWWGTGTGAAPVIAAIAQEQWILTVWVVTKPFSFEGKKRLENAVSGLEKLKPVLDTLIIIPNDKIFNIIDKKTTFKQAFTQIDKILYLWVQWISDLIIKPGLINIDFADVNVIMKNSGTALLGIWYGEGENRTMDATRQAIENPLLEIKLEWAQNIVFAVTGWEDLTPMEVQEAASIVEDVADDDANIIWGMTMDDSFDWEVKVTIIATGFPEVTQDTIIGKTKRGSRLGTLNNPMKKSKGSDFVSKTLKKDSEKAGEKSEMEVPAFMRKKVK